MFIIARNALPQVAAGRAHRFDFSVLGIQLLQGAAARQRSGFPHAPERNFRFAQSNPSHRQRLGDHPRECDARWSLCRLGWALANNSNLNCRPAGRSWTCNALAPFFDGLRVLSRHGIYRYFFPEALQGPEAGPLSA